MLQQTRVDTVLPRYESFLERFPDLRSLASASVDAVLAEWSGLGYYRRARLLHRAARILVDNGGEFPETLEGWRALPGIGEYTAAAIASMVYDIREPVLDGNVIRLMSRLEGERRGGATAASRRRLRKRARGFIDPSRPGDSNQALMELGATVCTPHAPGCPRCPVADACVAYREGRPEAYPEPRRRRAAEKERHLSVVVQRGKQTLMFRRPVDEMLMPGLWELPWVELDGGSASAALASRYGGSWQIGKALGVVTHSITHRILKVEIRAGRYVAAGLVQEGPEAGWFDERARQALPLSSLVEKVLSQATGAQRSIEP